MSGSSFEFNRGLWFQMERYKGRQVITILMIATIIKRDPAFPYDLSYMWCYLIWEHEPFEEKQERRYRSLAAQQSCVSFPTFPISRLLQMFPVAERCRLQEDQLITWTLLLQSHPVVIVAACSLALSCWNIQCLAKPSEMQAFEQSTDNKPDVPSPL